MRRHWTPTELDTLRRDYPTRDTADLAADLCRTLRSVYQRATLLGLRKDPAQVRAAASARAKTHTSGRFKPGSTPWNKGKKGVNGVSPGRFKPGNIPHTHLPIGTERLKSGYLCRKVSDAGGRYQRWRPVHHLIWEQHHGRTIPAGHIVIFRDGNPDNRHPDNLEAITRRQLAERNHVKNLPEPLREVIYLKARLSRRLNTLNPQPTQEPTP